MFRCEEPVDVITNLILSVGDYEKIQWQNFIKHAGYMHSKNLLKKIKIWGHTINLFSDRKEIPIPKFRNMPDGRAEALRARLPARETLGSPLDFRLYK